MKSVTVEIIFKNGTRTDRTYHSDADDPEEDALEKAREEWGCGKGSNVNVIRVISVDDD